MAVVVLEPRPDFTEADLDMFRETVARLIEPFNWAGWSGWELRAGEGRESAAIECVNPNDWEFLTFSRTADGAYRARDGEGQITDADSFSELLVRVGFVDN